MNNLHKIPTVQLDTSTKTLIVSHPSNSGYPIKGEIPFRQTLSTCTLGTPWMVGKKLKVFLALATLALGGLHINKM